MLGELGALDEDTVTSVHGVVAATGGNGPAVWCFLEPGGERANDEMLGEAAEVASLLGGSVTAVVPEPVPAGLARARGADRILAVPGDHHPERWAAALGEAAAHERPWALLLASTRAGRTVASLVAARHGWGLTGDAIGLEVADDGRLLAWKPAFGGRLVAPIESDSPVQMVTVRRGSRRRGGRGWPTIRTRPRCRTVRRAGSPSRPWCTTTIGRSICSRPHGSSASAPGSTRASTTSSNRCGGCSATRRWRPLAG